MILAVVLAACSSSPSSSSRLPSPASPGVAAECQTIQHDFGQIDICGQPQRIVALDPHALDLLLALGVEPVGYAEDARALVGSPQSGKPTVAVKYLGDRLRNRPIHVGTRQEPSLEAITELQPDLIFSDLWVGKDKYSLLSQISPTLLLDGDKSGWQRSLQILAQALSREDQAQRVIQNHQQQIQQTKADLEPVSRQTNILLLSMSGLGSIEIFNAQTFAGGLLQDLGLQLVTPKLSYLNGASQISLEVLPQIEADRIIVMVSGNSSVEQVKTEWRQNPILKQLPASQAGQVYFVDYQLWSRITGPIAAELVINQTRDLLLPSTKSRESPSLLRVGRESEAGKG